MIAISAGQIANFGIANGAVEFRWYSRKSVTTADGDIIVGSRPGEETWYQSFTGTVNGDTIDYAGHDIAATEDATPVDNYYSLVAIVDGVLTVVFKKIYVPPSPTTTTIDALWQHSEPGGPVADALTYSRTVLDAMFASLTNMATKMTEVIYGSAKLSVPAASASVPIVVGDNDPRVPYISSKYATLSAAITAIGATKARLIIDSNLVVNAADVVPSTLLLEGRAGSLLTKSGSGTITFQGFGLADPTSQVPIFSGFAAGNITWTGTDAPAEISTELWSTGNTSLSDRLARADLAFPSKRVKIIAYPRTITATTTFSQYRHLHFTTGDYPTSITTDIYPFVFASDFTCTADAGATINLSYLGSSGGAGFKPSSLNTPIENIFFDGLHFLGDLAGTPNGANSVIISGAAATGYIRNCVMEDLYQFTVIGSDGTLGNYPSNFDISNCKFINCATQAVAVLNGDNVQVMNNYFDVRGITQSSNNTQIDIEPNAEYDNIDGLTISNNVLDLRSTGVLYQNGIAVQGGASNVYNVVVSNNVVIGDSSVGAALSGISITGVDGVRVSNNTVFELNQRGMQVVNCHNVLVDNNDLHNCGDATFSAYAIHLYGCRDVQVKDNALVRGIGAGLGRATGIYEAESLYPATSAASTVTLVWPGRTKPFWIGLTVTLNGTDYVVATQPDYDEITTTVAPGTLAVKTAASATDVDTGTDTIMLGAHNFINNCVLRYTAGTAAIAGLTDGADYYVVGRTGTTIQLSLTLGGAAINLTGTGTGTQTFTPVLKTKFSNNIFHDNEAERITLETSGTSQILSTFTDKKITNVADTAYTVLPADGIVVYTTLTAPRIATLPTAVGCKGKEYVIKDGAGAAATHNITVDGNGSETVDGAANAVISTNYGKVKVKSDGANWFTV